MNISLIISVYKNIEFLDLVLGSVGLQSYDNFEVVVAEDNDSPEMKEFIETQKANYSFQLKHVFQRDCGFRKTRILNKAVKASDGDFLVFIDGDCMIHKRFLEQYAKQAEDATCLFGQRVMLSQKLSIKILQTKNHGLMNLWNLFISGSSKIEEGIYLPFVRSFRKEGIKGCNIGLPKALIEKINGFDEDYEKPWGGEDTDLERRLRLVGARFKYTKFQTIQYHLYHALFPRGNPKDKKVFNEKKKRSDEWFCKNGLMKE